MSDGATQGEEMSKTEYSRLKVNPNGTVYDVTTGLTWQREISSELFTWKEAKQYTASLSLEGGSWRLPTAQELFGLLDLTRCLPAINTEVFPNTPNAGFWSSSPYAYDNKFAWVVYFNDGYVNSNDVASYSRVRCVR